MTIRNAAKAMIIQDGMILLNKCVSPCGQVYYDLPGGGQKQFETMEDAVIRECLEETGRLVKIIRFAVLCEEIYGDEEMRKQYLDYTHRVHHIFVADLVDDIVRESSELDYQQDETKWVDINEVPSIDLRPLPLKEHFFEILHAQTPLYLGSVHV